MPKCAKAGWFRITGKPPAAFIQGRREMATAGGIFKFAPLIDQWKAEGLGKDNIKEVTKNVHWAIRAARGGELDYEQAECTKCNGGRGASCVSVQCASGWYYCH